MAKGDIPNTEPNAPMNSVGQKMVSNPGGSAQPWQTMANSGSSYPMGMPNRQPPMGPYGPMAPRPSFLSNFMNNPIMSRPMMGSGMMGRGMPSFGMGGPMRTTMPGAMAFNSGGPNNSTMPMPMAPPRLLGGMGMQNPNMPSPASGGDGSMNTDGMVRSQANY